MKTDYAATTRLLVDSFDGLTPEMQKAARYMMDNPEEVGLYSMRSVARKAGVKPATISRLSKSLGFRAYDELREPFRQRLRKTEPGFAARLKRSQQRAASGDRKVLEDLREIEVANVEDTLSDANTAVLAAAADTIHGSRRVYVLGLRGAYAPAFLFHYAYQLFQENSRLVDTRAGIFADQLRGITEQDSLLVVSFPPYTQLTIDAVHYAADAGAKIVAVTDSALSPVAKSARHAIVALNRSTSFYHSFTGALAATQALISLLVARKGGDAVKIVQQAEEQLSRISAYW